MDAREPITIVIGRFEDLIARGLRSLIAEDANIELLADGVELDALDATLAEHEPKVAIINFGSLRTPVEVNRLHTKHPDTRLLVLANRPTPSECNQMLAFGATACLSKETEARDILNAIHLASRGLHVLPAHDRRPRPRAARAGAAHAARGRRARAPAGGPLQRRDRARAVGERRDRAHPPAQHLPQARRAHAPRAGVAHRRRDRARARAAADDLRGLRRNGRAAVGCRPCHPALARRAARRRARRTRPHRDGTPVRGARRRSARRGRRPGLARQLRVGRVRHRRSARPARRARRRRGRPAA